MSGTKDAVLRGWRKHQSFYTSLGIYTSLADDTRRAAEHLWADIWTSQSVRMYRHSQHCTGHQASSTMASAWSLGATVRQSCTNSGTVAGSRMALSARTRRPNSRTSNSSCAATIPAVS